MLSLEQLTDLELANLLKSGDHAVFTEIYNRHWKFLFNSAYSALRDKESSMDVCQTVFLWIWENRERVTVKNSLKAYLHTAVKYKIANLIRQGKVRESLLDNILGKELQADETLALEVKELKHFISQLINELPEKCREVFLMSRNENLSHKQIAERLGISEKTVNDHITRALKKLREPLAKMATIFLTL